MVKETHFCIKCQYLLKQKETKVGAHVQVEYKRVQKLWKKGHQKIGKSGIQNCVIIF